VLEGNDPIMLLSNQRVRGQYGLLMANVGAYMIKCFVRHNEFCSLSKPLIFIVS